MGGWPKACLIFSSGLLLAACLLGCPSTRPSASDDEEGLVGQVFFPGYQTQAAIGDVATAATVSLIDPVLNETRATSLTDSRGRFSLTFRGTTLANQTYYLEAVKGLNSNAVGKDAVRVRTLVQRQNKNWTSLNSRMPGSAIYLNTSTTALALIVSLRQATSPATPSLLIGSLSIDGSSDSFWETGTGLMVSEFNQVRGLVAAALTADTDPFFALQYVDGSYSLKPGTTGTTGPVITYLQPAIASLGDKVVIHGAGFSPTLVGNLVTFAPSVGAVVATASETAIEVTVPGGATTGELRVAVGSEAATASFTLMPPVTGGLNP